MPKAKKASLDFTQIQLNLLIRASDHLKDAYIPSKTPGDKATVTNLQKMRDRLSKAGFDYITDMEGAKLFRKRK